MTATRLLVRSTSDLHLKLCQNVPLKLDRPGMSGRVGAERGPFAEIRISVVWV